MTDRSDGLWLSLTSPEADRLLSWLLAIGFTEHAVFRSEQNPQVIVHAELLWPAGGGVMLGTTPDEEQWPNRPGMTAAYLVTDDPDEVYATALAAGASSMHEPRDNDYGGRGAGVRDPDGNLWSFGSYRPT